MDAGDDTRPSIRDPRTLRRLFQHLERTDVDELEVVHGATRLYLRRDPGKRTAVVEEIAKQQDDVAGVPITAPLTGVFYIRSGPNQPPFVTPGETIQLGQVVALIETMKLYNEVIADVAGEVLQIHASDGDLVEAGYPLIHVLPEQEEEKP